MRRNMWKIAGLATLLAVPAVAFADSTTYNGEGTSDPQATIELKITDASERRVVKVVARKIPFSGGSCTSSGRTPRTTLKGDFRVKGNGEFRAVGGVETADPLEGGQLNVLGDATRNKVTGTMRYTFGKDGCDSETVDFKATR